MFSFLYSLRYDIFILPSPFFTKSLWFKAKICFDWLIRFYFTGFWFHAFSRKFPCCCFYFSLVIDIKSTERNCESYSFAIAINLLEVFHKTFYQMSGNENLLWPMDYTALNIHSRVYVMKVIWKQSVLSKCIYKDIRSFC